MTVQRPGREAPSVVLLVLTLLIALGACRGQEARNTAELGVGARELDDSANRQAPGASAPANQEGAGSSSLLAMSFNLRYGTANDGLNAWALRRDLVLRVIRAEAPDLLGVQEALEFQLDWLTEHLPEYASVGVGRDDGERAGEFSAILYHRERFEVLGQGTFWLSETPTEAGSTSWGNRIPRICTWAELVDRRGDRTLHVFNTHFDHASQPSRESSARLIRERLEAEARGGPAIVMGDFNAGEQNPAFLQLVGDGTLRDSFRVLNPGAQEVGTFNHFRGETGGEKIDALLVTEHWTVLSASINRTMDGARCPSDHFPVQARLLLNGE